MARWAGVHSTVLNMTQLLLAQWVRVSSITEFSSSVLWKMCYFKCAQSCLREPWWLYPDISLGRDKRDACGKRLRSEKAREAATPGLEEHWKVRQQGRWEGWAMESLLGHGV